MAKVTRHSLFFLIIVALILLCLLLPQGVLHLPGVSTPRFYYFVNSYFNRDVFLLNKEREPLKHWHLSPACPKPKDTYSKTDGHLQLVVPARAGGLLAIFKHRELTQFDWDGNPVWKLCMPAHHEIIQKDGRILTLSLAERRVAHKDTTFPILVDVLLEVDPESGSVMREHSLYDALKEFGIDIPLKKARKRYRDKSKRYEVIHSNGIAHFTRQIPEIANIGDLIISAKHLSLVFTYSLKTEKVSWAWGDEEIQGQHSPQLLPNGNLLLFDNAKKKKGSRIIELDLYRRKIVWEHPKSKDGYFYNPTMGNSQLLADGLILAGLGHLGVAFAVNRNHTVVWKWENRLLASGKPVHKKPLPFYRLVQFADSEYPDLRALSKNQADN